MSGFIACWMGQDKSMESAFVRIACDVLFSKLPQPDIVSAVVIYVSWKQIAFCSWLYCKRMLRSYSTLIVSYATEVSGLLASMIIFF